MFYKFFKISKYKNVEIEIGFLKTMHDYFDFNLSWSRRQDHAGYFSYISIGRLKFELNIHDIRHWDRTLNKWEPLPENEEEDNWDDYIGV